MTWPPVVCLRADVVCGACREAGDFDAAGHMARCGWPEGRRARAAMQSASMPLSTGPPVAGRWADVGGGHGLRDERAVLVFLGGWPWPLSRCWSGPAGRTRPVHADRFGRRGGGGGPALAPCPRLGWSGWSDGTGSRGPGGEDGGLALTPCSLVGGPAGPTGTVHADRYGRRGGGGGGRVREALAAPFYRRIAVGGSFRGRSLRR